VSTRSGPLQIAPFPWPVRSNLMAQDEFRGVSEEELVREIEKRSADGIEALAADVDSAIPAVLVAHVMADKAETSGSEYYAAIMRDPRLARRHAGARKFDYVALGHVHKFQDLNKASNRRLCIPVRWTASTSAKRKISRDSASSTSCRKATHRTSSFRHQRGLS
jgi:exonuclease SbcD